MAEPTTVHTSEKIIKRLRFMGRGIRLNGATSVAEVLTRSGFDWTVSSRGVLTLADKPRDPDDIVPLTGNGTPEMEELRANVRKLLKTPGDNAAQSAVRKSLKATENCLLPVPHAAGIVRDDTNLPFAVMGRIYQTLTNEECIGVIDPVLSASKAVVDKAGAFRDGGNCWLLVKFPKRIKVGTEELDRYMKLSWSHNGTEKLSATFVAVYRKGHAQISPPLPGETVSVEIRHTTNAKDRLKFATDLLSKGDRYFAKLETVLIDLINTPWSDKEMQQYLEALLPDKGGKPNKHGEVKKTQAARKQEEIFDLFRESDEEIEGTKYAAFAAISAWCDFAKPTRVTGLSDDEEPTKEQIEELRDEARLESSWNGTARKMKDSAFKLLIQ
jgi:phage/plasmid-like protein (TIGR03299 family)